MSSIDTVFERIAHVSRLPWRVGSEYEISLKSLNDGNRCFDLLLNISITAIDTGYRLKFHLFVFTKIAPI